VDTRAIGIVLIHHKIPGAHRKKKWTVGTGSVQTTGRKQRCVRKKQNCERNMWTNTQSLTRCKLSYTFYNLIKLINGVPMAQTCSQLILYHTPNRQNMTING